MFCEKTTSLGAYGKRWPILFKSYLVLDKNIYICMNKLEISL